jgi:hypothetical protein
MTILSVTYSFHVALCVISRTSIQASQTSNYFSFQIMKNSLCRTQKMNKKIILLIHTCITASVSDSLKMSNVFVPRRPESICEKFNILCANRTEGPVIQIGRDVAIIDVWKQDEQLAWLRVNSVFPGFQL